MKTEREITQRIFDEISDHLTWEQCEAIVEIFKEEYATQSTQPTEGKDLSEITDEDAIELLKLQLNLPNLINFEIIRFFKTIYGFEIDYRWNPKDVRFAKDDGFCYSSVGMVNYALRPDKMKIKEAQYLQSRGYKLPVYFTPPVRNNTKDGFEEVLVNAIKKGVPKFKADISIDEKKKQALISYVLELVLEQYRTFNSKVPTEKAIKIPTNNNLAKDCFMECLECGRLRLFGTFCKDATTGKCDNNDRYFYSTPTEKAVSDKNIIAELEAFLHKWANEEDSYTKTIENTVLNIRKLFQSVVVCNNNTPTKDSEAVEFAE